MKAILLKLKFNLLIFLYFLLRAYGAELFSLLIGDPEIVLSHPQMENPDAVHAHKQYCICHQLRGKSRGKAIIDTLFSILLQYISSSKGALCTLLMYFITH